MKTLVHASRNRLRQYKIDSQRQGWLITTLRSSTLHTLRKSSRIDDKSWVVRKKTKCWISSSIGWSGEYSRQWQWRPRFVSEWTTRKTCSSPRHCSILHKMILEQRIEIKGISTIEWHVTPWKRSTQSTKAVESKSTHLLRFRALSWKAASTPYSHERWKEQLEYFLNSTHHQELYGIDGESFDFEWNILPRTLQWKYLKEIQVRMTVHGIRPEEFEDRIIFLSMFNDIDTGQNFFCKDKFQWMFFELIDRSSFHGHLDFSWNRGHLKPQKGGSSWKFIILYQWKWTSSGFTKHLVRSDRGHVRETFLTPWSIESRFRCQWDGPEDLQWSFPVSQDHDIHFVWINIEYVDSGISQCWRKRRVFVMDRRDGKWPQSHARNRSRWQTNRNNRISLTKIFPPRHSFRLTNGRGMTLLPSVRSRERSELGVFWRRW